MCIQLCITFSVCVCTHWYIAHMCVQLCVTVCVYTLVHGTCVCVYSFVSHCVCMYTLVHRTHVCVQFCVTLCVYPLVHHVCVCVYRLAHRTRVCVYTLVHLAVPFDAGSEPSGLSTVSCCVPGWTQATFLLCAHAVGSWCISAQSDVGYLCRLSSGTSQHRRGST